MSNNPGSRVSATGLAIMLLAVSAGVGSSDFGVLLGLVGVLVGASTISVGICRMGEELTTPTCPAVLARLGTLTAFLRRNIAVVGLIIASSAVTAVAGGDEVGTHGMGHRPTMIPGSRVTAIGVTILLLAVSAGVYSNKSGLLLGFAGVVVSANFIAIGVRRMGEEPETPTCPAALGALMAFLRRNLTVMGLIMASSAVMAVAGGEARPVLCCGMVPLFLLGLYLINIRVLRE